MVFAVMYDGVMGKQTIDYRNGLRVDIGCTEALWTTIEGYGRLGSIWATVVTTVEVYALQ
jgi:hypothetical protein